MNYVELSHIDDVLPFIEGNDSFYIKDTSFGKIVNYHSIVDAFTHEPDHYPERVRRECRGLKFRHDGSLLSRPFHKFFNVGEREETKISSLPREGKYVIAEKLDGSMITVTRDETGRPRLMTKMGVTETSERFEAEFSHLHGKKFEDFMRAIDTVQGTEFTMIFEGVAPWNRIVVGYDRPELVLIAIRHNWSGKYTSLHGHIMEEIAEQTIRGSLRVVRSTTLESFEELVDHLNRMPNVVGSEGAVVSHEGGLFKAKTEWYRSLHASRDDFSSSPRRRLELALHGRLDDVMPILSEAEAFEARALVLKVSRAVNCWSSSIEDLVFNHVNSSQKEFATSEGMKSLVEVDPALATAAFVVRSKNRDARETLIEVLLNCCRKTESAQRIEEAMSAC